MTGPVDKQCKKEMCIELGIGPCHFADVFQLHPRQFNGRSGLSFAEVGSTLDRFWGWAPATKSMLKIVDQVGPVARPFLESQPAPSDDGDILIVEVDGGGAPMITDTEMSRRKKPHKKRPRGET